MSVILSIPQLLRSSLNGIMRKYIEVASEVISFAIGMENRQLGYDLDNPFTTINVPEWLKLYNKGMRCDTLLGPCACGAWHHHDETRYMRERK